MRIGMFGSGLMGGKLIITCSLPMNADNSDLVVAHTVSGAAIACRFERFEP